MLRYVMVVIAAAGLGIGAAYLKNSGLAESAVAAAQGALETTAADPKTSSVAVEESEPKTARQKRDELEANAAELSKLAEDCQNRPTVLQMVCAMRMRGKMEKTMGAVSDLLKGGASAEE